jgi:hypothetical protein
VSDATISGFSLWRAKANFCMTTVLLLCILENYYLNGSVTVLQVCKYILQSQNTVKPFPFLGGEGGGVQLRSWWWGNGEVCSSRSCFRIPLTKIVKRYVVVYFSNSMKLGHMLECSLLYEKHQSYFWSNTHIKMSSAQQSNEKFVYRQVSFYAVHFCLILL